jgi:hypothetical protein
MTTRLDHEGTSSVLAAQVGDYAELSSVHAAGGEARRAALAVWASDVRAVQSLLWEGGLADAEDPAGALAAVSAAVETALLARDTSAAVTLREVVEDARAAVMSVFDPSVHEQLSDRFVSLSHLDDLPAPATGSANLAVVARLDGRGGEELVGDLLTAAADCRAVAGVMAATGDEEEADHQTVMADLAAYEAYLVLASAASGDATLATTELRWDLAVHRARRDAAPGTTPSVQDVRGAMAASVVPAEEQVLDSVLGPERVHGSAG